MKREGESEVEGEGETTKRARGGEADDEAKGAAIDSHSGDGAAAAAVAAGTTSANNDEDEKEEGELSEDEGEIDDAPGGFKARADKAWRLDLKRPSRDRIAKIPLEWACSRGKPLEGLWLEFGVFSGKTINLMARHAPPGRTVYGFDTFEGLPESWRDKFDKGTFDCKGKFPKVADNVTLVKGLFQDSLEPFLAKHDGAEDQKVAVAHLDADLYSATIYTLRQLAPRIVPGTLLVFDELINYPGFEEHEWKALLEAAEEFGWTFEWVAQSAALEDPITVEIPEAQQVALRITGTNKFFS
ncbi:Hypothetical Protein FCC1311_000732 [Hondaea fermentalgiana]|uniref:Macrocin O-methyltransferase n=1 Tax=Hondaea fermentalgiana TaxID=2315210 RepID=A0A2R5G5X6_9STRA|nr:Hypothetical Protein FCC1311_000732 [Hondaea fermentalgiana]|eukprot:GBG23853.1 Hypothetical Protein FCC1311_000732 [Hondaea fermentalgiana]